MDMTSADLIALELSMVEPHKTKFELMQEEGGLYELFTNFQTAIKRIINKMMEYIDQLKIDISTIVMRKQMKNKLAELRRKIESGEAPKRMMFVDVKSAIDTYESGIGSMRKKLAKIMKFKCRSLADIRKLDDKIDNFMTEIDDFEEDVLSTIEKPMEFNSNDILKYLEYWSNGKVDIFDSYYAMIRDLKSFANSADHLLTDKALSSTNAVHCHRRAESMISKISTKASSTMRKIVIKTILYFD